MACNRLLGFLYGFLVFGTLPVLRPLGHERTQGRRRLFSAADWDADEQFHEVLVPDEFEQRGAERSLLESVLLLGTQGRKPLWVCFVHPGLRAIAPARRRWAILTPAQLCGLCGQVNLLQVLATHTKKLQDIIPKGK